MYTAFVTKLTELLREASEAHHTFESRLGHADTEWAAWYADYIVRRLLAPKECPFRL